MKLVHDAALQAVVAARSRFLIYSSLFLFTSFQETMTEPSVYVEDVSKLKDAGELKQAYVGLKDTNRYFVTASLPPNLQVFTIICVEFTRPRHLSYRALAPLLILP